MIDLVIERMTSGYFLVNMIREREQNCVTYSYVEIKIFTCKKTKNEEEKNQRQQEEFISGQLDYRDIECV